jgi:hypothetical protein
MTTAAEVLLEALAVGRDREAREQAQALAKAVADDPMNVLAKAVLEGGPFAMRKAEELAEAVGRVPLSTMKRSEARTVVEFAVPVAAGTGSGDDVPSRTPSNVADRVVDPSSGSAPLRTRCRATGFDADLPASHELIMRALCHPLVRLT